MNVDTSESENDSLRQELIAEKECNSELVEEQVSLKLVVKLLSKDLYNKSNDSTPLPKENGNGNINVVDNTISTPIVPPAESAKTTVILGDSIIQNLQGSKLGKEINQQVVVKSFSGATTQDMKSYIQPTINNAPDRICLHIGTNDLKSKAPNDITNGIVDLAKTVQSTCGAEVVLSELTTCKDAHKESVKSVNKLLIKYSKQHYWSLVHHSNITEKVLNRGGLHLTKQGNELLYKNFASRLVAKEANNH